MPPGTRRLWTIGGLQSNHARTVAAVAARLGLECHWVCRTPDGFPPSPDRAACAPYSNLGGNYFLSTTMLDAVMHYCTPEDYVRGPLLLQELISRHDAEVGDNLSYLIPEGASFPPGIWGYIRAFASLVPYLTEQLAEEARVDAIVVAVGSGGTLAGLVLGQYLCSRAVPEISADKLRIIGVPICDDAAYFRDRVCGQILETVAAYGAEFGLAAADFASLAERSGDFFDLWDGHVGDGYGTTSPEQVTTMRTLAATTGIALDPTYSGKAFDALVHRLRRGETGDARNFLFVHTGGVFGLLAQCEKLADMAQLPSKKQADGEKDLTAKEQEEGVADVEAKVTPSPAPSMLATRGPSGSGKSLVERPFLHACEQNPVLKTWVRSFTLNQAESDAVLKALKPGKGYAGKWPSEERQEDLHNDDRQPECVRALEAAIYRSEQGRPCEGTGKIRDNYWTIELSFGAAFADDVDLSSADPSINDYPTEHEAEEARKALAEVTGSLLPDGGDDDNFPYFFCFSADHDNFGTLENGGIVLESPTEGCYFMTEAYFD